MTPWWCSREYGGSVPGTVVVERNGEPVTGIWTGTAYVFPFGVVAPRHLRPVTTQTRDGATHTLVGQDQGREPTGAQLLVAAVKMPDAALSRDLPVVVGAATCDADRTALRAYSRLRRRARGFRPADYHHNSHAAIDRTALERLTGASAVLVGRAETCTSCGSSFAARRSTARYCSSRCRERTRRARASA